MNYGRGEFVQVRFAKNRGVVWRDGKITAAWLGKAGPRYRVLIDNSYKVVHEDSMRQPRKDLYVVA